MPEVRERAGGGPSSLEVQEKDEKNEMDHFTQKMFKGNVLFTFVSRSRALVHSQVTHTKTLTGGRKIHVGNCMIAKLEKVNKKHLLVQNLNKMKQTKQKREH